ncbi:PspC domain-containing protein [Phaeodactylibacter sp.]|uniref:PspC domain-containing protein n=1 Tax=Phaeodactylibacter sp. TaxID=1940289 RepID=UPI0025E874C1|nr:PspC domain-containing protein [Phaeodactylibacter sp.]MCI4647809.1 PspC domain-containing protein [Phaeodactylibacter sp.]MCI5092055.1 PspC domain-containing protein [Phaeodactylibacter sp.]
MKRKDQAVIGGVCAGIADYYSWDPTNVRLFYVLLSVLSAAFPGLLVYVLLWLFMPER